MYCQSVSQDKPTAMTHLQILKLKFPIEFHGPVAASHHLATLKGRYFGGMQ